MHSMLHTCVVCYINVILCYIIVSYVIYMYSRRQACHSFDCRPRAFPRPSGHFRPQVRPTSGPEGPTWP